MLAFSSSLRRTLLPRLYSTNTTSFRRPWFIAEENDGETPSSSSTTSDASQNELKPIPDDAPDYLKTIHSHLSTSPYLETSFLTVATPMAPEDGPGLPRSLPRGRRMRGRSYAGEGLPELIPSQGVWDWVVLAQVKEGTEGRGAIEALAMDVRSTLMKSHPELPVLSRAIRRTQTDGWALLDMGDSVIHIVSKEAREKWFERGREW